MRLLKRLAKNIGKVAKSVGKAAPSLITHALTAGSGPVVGMVAEALGIGGVGPEVIEKHLKDNPEASIDALLQMEQEKRRELELIIEDRKDARKHGTALSTSSDRLLRLFLPCLTIIIFGTLIWFFYKMTSSAGDLPQAANIIIGALVAASNQALNFWFGQGDRDQAHSHKASEGLS
jgi:hypothetical protein